jgi:hypothetical protein
MYTKREGLYTFKKVQRSDQGISTTGDLRSKPVHGLETGGQNSRCISWDFQSMRLDFREHLDWASNHLIVPVS